MDFLAVVLTNGAEVLTVEVVVVGLVTSVVVVTVWAVWVEPDPLGVVVTIAGFEVIGACVKGPDWNAPMSIAVVGRTLPRWSVLGTLTPAMEVLPAPMAGLPLRRAIVCVGPPFAAREASLAFRVVPDQII